MREEVRRIGGRQRPYLGKALLGLLLAGVGQAYDEERLDNPVSDFPRTNHVESIAATSPASKSLNLLLTQSELRAFVRSYEIQTGEVLTVPIDDDEVIVTAPAVLAPMRDVSQDAWGGIAAPFWAIMHPKDAWRIFVPIPPKSDGR